MGAEIPEIEITPEMKKAGVESFFRHYGDCFDALQGDPYDFVATIFNAMAKVEHQSHDQDSATRK